MALCPTVRREELMEVQRRLIDCQHKNAALTKTNDELRATVFELNKWKSEISDIAAEADASFQLQKNQWDEERLALDRRNHTIAEERNQQHHELCTVKIQLEQATKSVQKKTEELNNLTIQHREYVSQHDGLPDRVARLQQEVDTMQKTVDDKTREIETVKYQYAARNAQQVEKLEQLRADQDTLTQAKKSDAKEAARSLAVAEASYNNELARIEGERLRQEETAQANLKIARQEAFAQGETAKRLASQLAASNAEVNALNEEASKTKQAIDKLRSEVSAAEEAKRVSQCEAAAAREEAEKARLSREDAVARLQRAAEAAADGTEEAMRVVHEYDVATQQQQEKEAELERRSREIDAQEAVIKKANAACAARAAELEAIHAQRDADSDKVAARQAALLAERQELDKRQAALTGATAALHQEQATFVEQQAQVAEALTALDKMHVALKGGDTDGTVGDGAVSEDGVVVVGGGGSGVPGVAGIMEWVETEQRRLEALQREVRALEAARDAAQQRLGQLKREELEAQSKVRGATAAAAAARAATERAEELQRAAEAAAAASAAAERAEERRRAAAEVAVAPPRPVVMVEVADEPEESAGPAAEDAAEEVEAASGIIGAISPLLGRLWGGQSRASATSKTPLAAVKEPPSTGGETSPVEFSVPGAALEVAAPTPQLGAVTQQPAGARTGKASAPKRSRAALHARGSGGGSGAEAGASADVLEAERGERTRRRVRQGSAENNGRCIADGKGPGDDIPTADGAGASQLPATTPDTGEHSIARSDAKGAIAEAARVAGTGGAVEERLAAVAKESGAATAGGDVATGIASLGKKKVSLQKAPRQPVQRQVSATAAVPRTAATPPADTTSPLAIAMETPLAEPAAAAHAGAAAVQKVTPPTIRTGKLSQVGGAAPVEGGAVASRSVTRGRRPPVTPAARPQRASAAAAAAAVAADAADNATPSASGDVPTTPGARPRRSRRTAPKRVQMLLEEAAHITGLTPSELLPEEDTAPRSARAARSASRAASKAGRESSVVEDGEEVEGGGHEGDVDSAEAEHHRKRRWRRTQTGTLRTPSEMLPHIEEEDGEGGVL